MGHVITFLRLVVERIAGDRSKFLRLGGSIIALILVGGSGFLGWSLEHLVLITEGPQKLAFELTLLIVLASCLAARSLCDNVIEVLAHLSVAADNDTAALDPAREQLGRIVGRDVRYLDRQAILRAASETAAENSVDGIFAPLFWMLVGCAIWTAGWESGPGPLSLALVYKSSSTIDSMLGYRQGRLLWLGSAGARLDDCLTWLPARLVLLTLPLISQPLQKWPHLVWHAQRDGALDLSPNSGISEAIFAYCAGVRMGGCNYYGERCINKPILAEAAPPPMISNVHHILRLSIFLETGWLVIAAVLGLMFT
ncbi:cobalamin biosynthesis protein CobD [cyanobiont of Ornithocercus magnificus]|nr:cobalamin biosynthesis protein CobD [cyanobiont of Ornithocercus magnificus]